MSAKFPKGRNAPELPAHPVETALPPAEIGKAPATTLSGAFAAALGAKPQLSHAGPKASFDGAGKAPPLQDTVVPRIRNSRPDAPMTPRKGHR